jgi:hypothetical protein
MTSFARVAYRALWVAGSVAALMALGLLDQALTGARAATVGI